MATASGFTPGEASPRELPAAGAAGALRHRPLRQTQSSPARGACEAAFVLLVMNLGVARLRLHSGVWGRLIEGTPTVLVQDGEVVLPHLRKEGIDREEVQMAIREHGFDSLSSVKLAVLETDGTISVVPMSAGVVRTRKSVRQFKKH